MTGKEIAQEILRQLGGNKFIAMTGAKNMCHDSSGTLMFKIGRNSTSTNHVAVEYDHGKDLYNLVFSRLAKYKLTEKKRYDSIFCDQLQELFTGYTGLYTSL